MARVGWLFVAAVLVLLRGTDPVRGQEQDPARSRNWCVIPAARKHAWWQKRHRLLNQRVKQRPVELVFIGDSITQGWEGRGRRVWQEFYGKRHAVNLGIGGDGTQHVLWRLDHGNLAGIRPKVAVVMIGTNNLPGHKPEHVAQGVAAIVEKIHRHSPQTKVLLLAIFPRGATPQDRVRRAVEATNRLLARLHDGKRVFFLDLNRHFLTRDGTLPREIMPDLVHPSEKGYRIWATAMEPLLARLLERQQ